MKRQGPFKIFATSHCIFKIMMTFLVVGIMVLSLDREVRGDLDLYWGSEAWERVDSGSAPSWQRRADWDVPHFGIYQDSIFTDLDNDGDYDAYITHNSNPIKGYENVGTVSSPVWQAKPQWDFLVPGMEENVVYSKGFVDLDSDGLIDLTVAKHHTIRAYKNVGGTPPGCWQRQAAWDISIQGYLNLNHAFADLDNDGDYDVLVDTWGPEGKAYENTGSASSPAWQERTEWAIKPGALSFDDLDGDGDYDILGTGPNYVSRAFENTGSPASPVWVENAGWSIPPWGYHQGLSFLVDIDGDFIHDVGIDIKPGSDPNSINLSSAGVIPVAILSSDTFDAGTIDPDTVSLAGARVKMVGKSGKYLCHGEDINGDTLPDLVCKVETAQFMIELGESRAVLEAETYAGQAIRGEDSVNIVPDHE